MRQVLITTLVFFSLVATSYADNIRIAVASNALLAIKHLSAEFARQTGHKVSVSSGSTGKLYAQIINGAPFDVFLAANVREPKKLESEGHVVIGSRFTYAVGNLALCAYKTKIKLIDYKDGIARLQTGDYQRLSIANPKVAPYGIAAKEFLDKNGLWNKVQDKLIQGENINQTYRFVISGNAQYALVALSQIKQPKAKKLNKSLDCVSIPSSMYSPLKQQSVLLAHAKHNDAAWSFMRYMQTDKTRKVLLQQFGYGQTYDEISGAK